MGLRCSLVNQSERAGFLDRSRMLDSLPECLQAEQVDFSDQPVVGLDASGCGGEERGRATHVTLSGQADLVLPVCADGRADVSLRGRELLSSVGVARHRLHGQVSGQQARLGAPRRERGLQCIREETGESYRLDHLDNWLL